MSLNDTPASRVAAARSVLRLLVRLGRSRVVPASPPADDMISSEAMKLALRRGWIERVEADGASTEPWRLSARGREFLKRAMSGQDIKDASSAAAVASQRGPAAATGSASPAVNRDESPLAWLRRHKGRDGRPLISDHAFQAGEKLRADFWFAGMTPRVTANWSAVPGGGSRTAAGAGAELRDGVVAAQERVRRALAAVGPELSGVLIDVCCHLKGLEDTESAAGWPQRSGKVVLQLALASLARHYGIEPWQPRGAQIDGGIRHWGTPDYRPSLDDWHE